MADNSKRVVIISDTHFGDDQTTLVKEKDGGGFELGEKFAAFEEAAGTGNGYLILLGDILDFSITSYEKAYQAAAVFFQAVKKIADVVVYVPGNHDADIWHTVEYQVNTIMRIEKGNPPRPFKRAVPGVLDLRSQAGSDNFNLLNVTPRKDGKLPYGGLFLEKLTNEPTDFYFAYPNVYLLTDDMTVLLTHGQYFETYWSLGSQFLPGIVGRDLEVGKPMPLADLVGLNFPLSQLACSGIGQAGKLTEVARTVQKDVKAKAEKLGSLENYLDNLFKKLDEMREYPDWKFWEEPWDDMKLRGLKKAIIDLVSNIKTSRREDFQKTNEFWNRFAPYYQACELEIEEINRSLGLNLQPPRAMIYGHTHQPIAWKTPTGSGQGAASCEIFNTGGWLEVDGTFNGAEVFTFRPDQGLRSTPIE